MSREDHARQLGELPIGRLLLKFSFPAVLGMLVNASYGIVDGIFVAYVFGSSGLAAVALSVPIMMISLSIGMMIGIGTNTFISIRIGQNRIDEAERLLGTALCLFLISAVVMTTLGLIYIEPLLRFFGADETTLPLAKTFLRVIICGTAFMQVSFGVNSFLRGEGRVHIAMVTLIISAIVNAVFSAFFLFVLKTGIYGPACATVIAQATSSIWIAWYYLSGRSLLRWRLRYIRFDFPRVRQICLMGLAPCMMNLANSVLLALANNQINKYGTGTWSGVDGLAVMRICQSLFLLVFSIILGISQGAQPILGYNTGAQRYDRVAKTLLITLVGVFGLCLVYTSIIQLFPHAVIYPFMINNPELAPLGEHACRIFMMMFPGVGVVVIISNYFQATGRGVTSLAITLARQVVVLIPFYYFLPQYWGLDGIWYATPFSDGFAVLICLVLLGFEYKRLTQRIARQRLNAT